MLFPRYQVARLHEMSGPARQVGGKRRDNSQAPGPGVDLRAAQTGSLGTVDAAPDWQEGLQWVVPSCIKDHTEDEAVSHPSPKPSCHTALSPPSRSAGRTEQPCPS